MNTLKKKRGKDTIKSTCPKLIKFVKKFPNSHNVIRKALRIPRTSFRRIIKRIEQFDPVNVKTNLQYQTEYAFTREQQILILNFFRHQLTQQQKIEFKLKVEQAFNVKLK